ncbi:MAG: Beta-barrel assembly-enhancing protease [Alphaproteobacteria bacterium MarineAlpha5_Bin11]|nr:peptidase M48 [Pelagibacteraceae bacterium]PPR44215.1 MAG: Beta-barrel assembly-enhancing protease [Alphaproteobacteria bacterium MarineAlpha5_Bin11]PPR51654.1 MAG: Beta-barrel assembly-enhancing protease [Alphaproteobacteria bacterium MarineAlpha5_Bin10]|tara:strand:- start:13929 stop:14837 length:909 start_codon:yes stop_codon:yes gene_type:complete
MSYKKLSRRNFFYGIFCSTCSALILPSCAEVPITKRKQLNFYRYNLPIIIPTGGGIPQIYRNEEHLNQVIEKQYAKFINDARSRNILIENTDESRELKEIGYHLSNSINKYYNQLSEPSPVKNFNWEFSLIDAKDNNGNPIKNAWCMPGGKIAFYSGIMPIAKNSDGIASIMGHEIAHAFARHTVEKLTQHSVVSLGTQGILKTDYGNIIAQNPNIYNRILKFGIMLPFSRAMESEADYMGLAFMKMSGFNLNESAEVWKRMMKNSESGPSLEFMSSHPSSKNRINNINNWIQEIEKDYYTV